MAFTAKLKLLSAKKEFKRFVTNKPDPKDPNAVIKNELRKSINAFLRVMNDENANASVKALSEKLNYQRMYSKNFENYRTFVNSCGLLASQYLKAESSRKLKFIDKNENNEDEKIKGKIQLDAYKLLFMSLVAMCSLRKSHREYGKKIYDKVKDKVDIGS